MQTAYEAIFIIAANSTDEQSSAIISKYADLLTRNGAQVDDVDRGEPRRLAYDVKKQREGIYVVINFQSEPAAKDELDRIFRISDDVQRFLVVKQDKRADRFPSRIRAAENERRERDQAARLAAQPAPASAPDQSVTELSASGAPVNSGDDLPEIERTAPVAFVPGTDDEPETATDGSTEDPTANARTGAAATENPADDAGADTTA